MSNDRQNYVFKYRAEIDGLRAVAVIPVVLFHAGLCMSGGFVGVDVFFVISGYLITGLILKELNGNTFSLSNFWERRARRILPAMTVVVLATLAVGYFLFLPWDYEELGRSAIAQGLFGANFHFWLQSGYFDGPAEMKPLLHTWSLAVEEQFYLLFPGFLLLLWRRLWSHVLSILLVLWASSFILSVVGSYYFPDATFYLLPGRAWELLTGALLAYWRPTPKNSADDSRMPQEIASVLGLALIFFAYFTFDGDTRFPGASALIPCLGTALFLWSNQSRVTLTGKILSLKPVVFVGLVSYSWYLWHWPAFAYLNRIYLGDVSEGQSLAVVLITFLLAVLSWRFVETPFRKRTICVTRRAIFKASLASLATCIGIGLFLDAMDGLPHRVPEAVLRIADQERNPEFRNKSVVEDAFAGKFQLFGVEDVTEDTPSLMLWGDSHGIAVAPVLNELAKEHGYVGYAALSPGTPPLLGAWVASNKVGRKAVDYNDAVFEFIKNEGIDVVFLACRWSLYYHGKGDGTSKGQLSTDDMPESGLAGAHWAFRESLLRTVESLHSAGVKVFIFQQVPDQRFDVPRELADRVWRDSPVGDLGISRDAHESYQRPIQKCFDELGDEAILLDPAEYFFSERERAVLICDGESLYNDEDHVSDAGAEFLRPLLQQVLSK